MSKKNCDPEICNCHRKCLSVESILVDDLKRLHAASMWQRIWWLLTKRLPEWEQL